MGWRSKAYCDWCYGPLSPKARGESQAIGLDREASWACEDCIRERRFERPPGGWDDSYPWPFYPLAIRNAPGRRRDVGAGVVLLIRAGGCTDMPRSAWNATRPSARAAWWRSRR